ncbi:MAG: ATP phosphoribosyltransferase [Spirochaetaceae bacterium]|jgi:ATP phosphoribosyltransferase|nr:ATP phosphoribosyltransferase [Spirochaetaceae bacterium]
MSLRILIPKGRIYENIARLFSEAGFPFRLAERSYRPELGASWLDAKIMKPQNVGELLELGSHDAGFTGVDWITESGAEVEEVLDLGFDKVRIIAAIPAGVSMEELGRRKTVVATEYVRLAEKYLQSLNLDYKIVRTYGATEVFPPDDADMIVDNTSSGQTLRENGLQIVGILLESSTRFFASKEALKDGEKRREIEELAMLFKAVIEARSRVMLEMNVSSQAYPALIDKIPAMRSPTVTPLHGKEGDAGFAVKIAVCKNDVPELIPRLKQLGATDIVEYDLRKVVQ